MHEQIRKRCVRLGKLLIETNLTVRALANATGYSKSTVHKDLTERLPNVDPCLSRKVAEILAYHKSIRHLRGGEATRQKWKNENEAQKADA
ncbi:stage III sporulation protein D [Sporosarcina sp. P26b]|uniref:sporulation transcriptional regulator SpoIIID n=1 Tax=Sporosarcina TaxID=1569 RepID=UPI000A17A359|nr:MULTISPECIES: sporulation transcriptional regulator SpoIIID [Sporosarcina]ARK22225.1 stage III sporulation protein D [Sporosarcina ureae]PIC74174.1 stage III sporulation protein D [Sporosarcina sp. P17b]PIC95733.1 stage III sporulation protein D [Sporosarcina sp. P26b]